MIYQGRTSPCYHRIFPEFTMCLKEVNITVCIAFLLFCSIPDNVLYVLCSFLVSWFGVLYLDRMRPKTGPVEIGELRQTVRNNPHAMLWSSAYGHTTGSLHGFWSRDCKNPYVYPAGSVRFTCGQRTDPCECPRAWKHPYDQSCGYRMGTWGCRTLVGITSYMDVGTDVRPERGPFFRPGIYLSVNLFILKYMNPHKVSDRHVFFYQSLNGARWRPWLHQRVICVFGPYWPRTAGG